MVTVNLTRPYKYYVALMTQAGGGAPVPTILENNIGTIIWARSAEGTYTATLAGAFTEDKTYTIAAESAQADKILSFGWNNVNQITLYCTQTQNGNADDDFTRRSIEIRVYT
jgi:hypothetical protein